MKDIKYIVETGEFIVDGNVIKESSLTESERKILLSKSKKAIFITGDKKSTNNNLII